MAVIVVNTGQTVTISAPTVNDISVEVPTVNTVSAIIYQGPKGDQGPAGAGSNLTGEVTSDESSVATISDNVVDEANLKVSNAPTNGYVLSANDAVDGGLQWVAATDAALQTEVDAIETSLGLDSDGTPPVSDAGDFLISDGTNFGVSVYSLPTLDGDDGQVLTTDGAGSVSFAYPKTISEDVKNVSGGILYKGTPVHVTGSVGNLAEVIAADAATNYPAHFVLDQDLANGGEGQGIALGFINNVDVPDASIYTEGQTVYLGASGGWTTVKPTGTNAIQNLGIIIKVNVSGNKISGIIMGAGRANDVPNIQNGYFWLGNASGVATPTDFDTSVSSNSAVAANTAKVTFPGFGTTAGTALEGNTALFDGDYTSLTNVPLTFAPSAHTHSLADITDSGTSAALDVAATGDAAAGEVVKGDDSRLTDARTPTSHTHSAGDITDFDTEVSNNTDVTANTAKISSKISTTSTAPTSASDFTIGGVEFDMLFDESATGTAAYLYGLNSASTAIYRWSGTRSTILTLDVQNFALQDSAGSSISTGTTYEIGADTSQWKSDCQGFNATYNNVSGGTLSGTNQISVSNRSSSQTWGSTALTIDTSDLTGTAPNQTLVDFRDGATAADFDVYYPTDATWDSAARKSLGFSLTANDGSTSDTASLTYYFKNRVFYGASSNSSLTSAQIIALANSPFTGSDYTLSSTSISTTGTQYVYYCYPSRFSGTPAFWLGGFETTFTELTDVSVTNSSGYTETYKVYQSPNQYTDATFTLEVL